MTPFDSVNFGHSLSVVFDFIHQYRKKGLSVPIVVSSVARTFPNCLRILELFFDDIRVLDVNKVYHFNEIYFFEQVILDISRHPDVIKETVDRALVRVPRSPSFTRKKVFLVKLANRQTNIITAHTAFEERLLVDRLRQTSDWVVIQPETMNIYEIIAYLVDASLIVTSEGAISYGHGIFFNRSAPLYFLRQSKSTKPYLYIDWMIHLQVGRFLDDHRDMIIGLPTTYPRPPVRKGPLWFLRR